MFQPSIPSTKKLPKLSSKVKIFTLFKVIFIQLHNRLKNYTQRIKNWFKMIWLHVLVWEFWIGIFWEWSTVVIVIVIAWCRRHRHRHRQTTPHNLLGWRLISKPQKENISFIMRRLILLVFFIFPMAKLLLR